MRNKMRRTKLITTMAVFIAIGTLASQLIWFPAGVAKAYPVQHAINVMAAVILGTGPAVTIAFIIGVLRNLLGLGSLLAFPGGMIGALFFIPPFLVSSITGGFIGVFIVSRINHQKIIGKNIKDGV